MQTMRWSLLFLALLAPFSIGCGGGGPAAPAATQTEAEAYFAENPEDAAPVEDVMESEGAPGN